MKTNKYGFSKTLGEKYWIKTSRAILADKELSTDRKMRAQEKLLKSYFLSKNKKDNNTRNPTVLRESNTNTSSNCHQEVILKLKLPRNTSRTRAAQEIKRLKNKSQATWKVLKLNKERTLRCYGLI